MKITIGGKTVKPGDLQKALMQQAAKLVGKEMQARFSAIRHPQTGEFPTVVVRGTSLDDMSLRVEGSRELLAIVRAQTSQQDLEKVEFHVTHGATPVVFLSYAGEDKDLADRISDNSRPRCLICEAPKTEPEMKAARSLRAGLPALHGGKRRRAAGGAERPQGRARRSRAWAAGPSGTARRSPTPCSRFWPRLSGAHTWNDRALAPRNPPHPRQPSGLCTSITTFATIRTRYASRSRVARWHQQNSTTLHGVMSGPDTLKPGVLRTLALHRTLR